ncbi:MAG: hypothetical protein RR383_03475 [Muribaculaceae bacterium]
MRTTILSIVACCTLTVSAQNVTITKQIPLLKGVENSAYYPVLSADGTQLLYTGEGQKGLSLYDFKDDVSIKITDAEQAGLYHNISKDGKIYFITQEKKDGINFRSVYNYDIRSKKSNVITSGQRNVMAPQPLNGGVVVKTSEGLKKTSKDKSTYVYTENSKVVVGKNGVEKAYSPVESYAGYLWASLSPDETKVMFFAAGKGIVIMTLDGKVLNMLGNYEKPVWYGNQYVVAQNATDDGHQYSSSQIILMKADGSFKKELTTPTSMTMHPTASAEAGRIVYDTIDGHLFLMELTINE